MSWVELVNVSKPFRVVEERETLPTPADFGFTCKDCGHYAALHGLNVCARIDDRYVILDSVSPSDKACDDFDNLPCLELTQAFHNRAWRRKSA